MLMLSLHVVHAVVFCLELPCHRECAERLLRILACPASFDAIPILTSDATGGS